MLVFLKRVFIVLFATVFFIGCKSSKEITKQLVYFQNLRDSAFKKVIYTDPTFQKGDQIYIIVSSEDKKTNEVFNQPNIIAGGGQAANANTPGVGYLVDENGIAKLPIIGSIYIEGMSKAKLESILSEKVKLYAKDTTAIINIRWLNYKITILGEVNHPGSFPIPNEKISIIDALGLAGDLNIYAKRNNIRVIREINGQREIGVMDLNNGNIFNSPFFYLRQNDIVYVEMNDRKVLNTDQTTVRNIGIAATVISTISLIITMILQFK